MIFCHNLHLHTVILHFSLPKGKRLQTGSDREQLNRKWSVYFLFQIMSERIKWSHLSHHWLTQNKTKLNIVIRFHLFWVMLSLAKLCLFNWKWA